MALVMVIWLFGPLGGSWPWFSLVAVVNGIAVSVHLSLILWGQGCHNRPVLHKYE